MTATVPSTVAADLGITPGYVRLLCRQHNIGHKLSPHTRLLQEQDVERLRSILASRDITKGGRPRKNP